MVKVYEWKMVPVQEMHAASVDGWERDSGPVLDALHFACLMRREVVPGRVAPEPSPEFAETTTQLRNCWSCTFSNKSARSCMRCPPEVAAWINTTHDLIRSDECPKDADGCPGWEAK